MGKITTDAEHAAAMMNCADGPQSLELYELVELVEDYEERRFPLTMIAAPTAPAPATESTPRKPPLAGRWCPHCGGLMLEYADGDHEECLDCSKAIEITPAAKAAKASGQVIVG